MLQTIPSQILSSEHIRQSMKVVIIESNGFSIPFLRISSVGSFANSPAKVAQKERIMIWLVSPPRMELWQMFRFFFRICEAKKNLIFMVVTVIRQTLAAQIMTQTHTLEWKNDPNLNVYLSYMYHNCQTKTFPKTSNKYVVCVKSCYHPKSSCQQK